MTTFRQNPPSLADQVLACLRGYSYRQTWVPEDRHVIQSILDEWVAEVDTLTQQLADRDATIKTLTTELSVWTDAAYGYRTP
jgi:hypothetical protein